jgi:adenylate kinase
VKILLLGPHGAGKSTQAHLLAASLHIPYISTGSMLRVFASQPGEQGTLIKERLERGDYFSDEAMIPLVRERLHQVDAVHGFILEGFPRTVAQAKALDMHFDIVIYLHLPPEVGTQRLLQRHRSDDTPEIIRHRLEQYALEADTILQMYRDQDILEQIDADRPVEVILADIFSRLNLNR